MLPKKSVAAYYTAMKVNPHAVVEICQCAVVSTKFTWSPMPGVVNLFLPTAEKEVLRRKWIGLYKSPAASLAGAFARAHTVQGRIDIGTYL